MTSLDDQIAALEQNREALKQPLRLRFAEVDAQIKALRKPEQDLQAERDRVIDTLTVAEDRALCAEIKAKRTEAEAAGVLDLEEQRKKILRALKDDDGKIRLAPAA